MHNQFFERKKENGFWVRVHCPEQGLEVKRIIADEIAKLIAEKELETITPLELSGASSSGLWLGVAEET